MTQILPPQLTPADVECMLAVLSATAAHVDAAREWVYFELGNPKTDPYPVVFVALTDEAAARRAAAEAVATLPALHAWVVAHKDDPDVIPDVYELGLLEVRRDEIDVCYVPTVNALWRNTFRKDAGGNWHPA